MLPSCLECSLDSLLPFADICLRKSSSVFMPSLLNCDSCYQFLLPLFLVWLNLLVLVMVDRYVFPLLNLIYNFLNCTIIHNPVWHAQEVFRKSVWIFVTYSQTVHRRRDETQETSHVYYCSLPCSGFFEMSYCVLWNWSFAVVLHVWFHLECIVLL